MYVHTYIHTRKYTGAHCYYYVPSGTVKAYTIVYAPQRNTVPHRQRPVCMHSTAKRNLGRR